jgi:hypothetical protein
MPEYAPVQSLKFDSSAGLTMQAALLTVLSLQVFAGWYILLPES